MSLALPLPDDAARLRQGSIRRRLVLATAGFGMLVSLLVIAAQLLMEYRNEVQRTDRRLDEVERSFVPSLAASLWLVDLARVELLLDGIAQLPGVAHVRLRTREGETFMRGDAAAASRAPRRYRLDYRDGEHFALGTLEVAVGEQAILAGLREQALRTALTTLVTLGLGSLLLMLLFQHWVTRHLANIAAYARGLSLQRLREPLVLEGKRLHALPDELDRLAEALNRMRVQVAADLAMREHYEETLVEHRARLEQLVAERTAELRETAEALARQRDAVQQLANTDDLTGIASRRYFGELARRELTFSRRLNTPSSLLMLDIDRFKAINDRWGHAVGDAAIKACADACAGELRETDLLGRMGGEEFAILLPSTDLAAAMSVAERIRRSIAALRIDTATGLLTLTVSIGAAEHAGEGLERLLQRADAALYAAKREGRDRVLADRDA